MKVLAISDLHLDFQENREALRALPPHPDDWLILAGDTGHRVSDLTDALAWLTDRFRRVVWVPGNHELWTVPGESEALTGEARYQHLVSTCRAHGVLTPEDPYEQLTIDGVTYVLAPLFLLYDYSFAPAGVNRDAAVNWAVEENILCADEHYLHADPHASVVEWCEARCRWTEQRLEQVPRAHRLVLINHFPLRGDLVRIMIPRFRIWCGTRRTEQWHLRFNVAAVVTGHLHVRATDVIDGVRFEEVSLGYPRQWRREVGLEGYLRQVLPLRGS